MLIFCKIMVSENLLTIFFENLVGLDEIPSYRDILRCRIRPSLPILFQIPHRSSSLALREWAVDDSCHDFDRGEVQKFDHQNFGRGAIIAG